MDAITIFGLCSATVMVAAYALERRSHWFIVLFAASCVAMAVYAFMGGNWVFGILELVWYMVAMQRWIADPQSGPGRRARARHWRTSPVRPSTTYRRGYPDTGNGRAAITLTQ
jgi:hypothetical protein